MNESFVLGLPWQAIIVAFIAVLGVGYRLFLNQQREQMRRVIREECQPPSPAEGKAPGAIWSTVNGHFDEKFEAQQHSLIAMIRTVLREERD